MSDASERRGLYLWTAGVRAHNKQKCLLWFEPIHLLLRIGFDSLAVHYTYGENKMNWIDKTLYLLRPENRWEWDDKALEQWCDDNFEETNKMLRSEQ